MPKRLQIAAILALVIVDVVAVAVAVIHVNSTPAGSSLLLPTETPSTETTPPAAPKAANGIAVSAETILLYSSGSCHKPRSAKLEISSDRGATFDELTLPVDTNGDLLATSIADVALTSKGISLVGRDADCHLTRFVTTDSGQNWVAAKSVATWLAYGGKVMTPTGSVVDPGCAAASVWASSRLSVRAVCDDGRIRATENGGQTWSGPGALSGGTAGVFVTVKDGFASGSSADCASRAFHTTDGGAKWAPLGCIDKDKKVSAMAGDSGLLAALIDGTVYASSDAGATWTQS
ncbi:MAG: hypothetical protein ABIR57_11280 [Aeromicrobium sp.]